MNIKYIDLIHQSYYFPQEEFTLEDENLRFHGIELEKLVAQYGTPLKFTYLPKISENIQRAKGWFDNAIKKNDYKGKYYYCYCTKSAHFKHVLEEALSNDIHIETSSAFDINIVESLKEAGKIKPDTFVICNGFKRAQYVDNIARLINSGHENCIPIIDNYEEISLLSEKIDGDYKIGIRIASEEEPKFEFYTSRLGIGYRNIVPFYEDQIKGNDKVELKMLHFFINTGIGDNAYYWNELSKCLKVYVRLKKICPSLDSLNIGGGFPIGALAGKREIMEVLDPRGKILRHPHSGTFSANPISMTAGRIAMELFDKKAVLGLNTLTDIAIAQITESIKIADVPVSITGEGSMFRLHLQATAPTCYREAFHTEEKKILIKELLDYLFLKLLLQHPREDVCSFQEVLLH